MPLSEDVKGGDVEVPLRYILLAVFVTFIWGSNFVLMAYALEHLPPLFMASSRFFLAIFPAMFLLKRPECDIRNLALYGILIGVGQYGLLFVAMASYISPGMASLVMQTQAFFTIGLAIVFKGERIERHVYPALLLTIAGLLVILFNTTPDDDDEPTTAGGLVICLIAALCWALGNITATRAGPVNMLAYVIWSSGFAFPPLLIMSFIIEGSEAIEQGLGASDAVTWIAVLWQAYGNTIFGYGVWAWLLSKFPAHIVSPLSLLVRTS